MYIYNDNSSTHALYIQVAYSQPVVKVVLWSRPGGSRDEARLEQIPYQFQPH